MAIYYCFQVCQQRSHQRHYCFKCTKCTPVIQTVYKDIYSCSMCVNAFFAACWYISVVWKVVYNGASSKSLLISLNSNSAETIKLPVRIRLSLMDGALPVVLDIPPTSTFQYNGSGKKELINLAAVTCVIQMCYRNMWWKPGKCETNPKMTS